jgi:2Fe-2S iron-sulfur cluster binding domain
MAKQHVSTIINGEPVEYLCEPQQTMLDVLRDELNLTGSKEGCSSGDCGACTVIVDGNIVCSCLMLGAEAEGRKITTIEGHCRGRQIASGAAEIPGARGIAMRFLHAGLHRRGQGFARRESKPDRGRDPVLAGWQSVPLHRL